MEQEGQPWMGSMGSPLATFGRRAAMDGQHGLTIKLAGQGTDHSP